MPVLRLLRLVLHLLQGLLTCALLFPFVDTTQRVRHIRRWSQGLLRICRVQLQVVTSHGAADAARALIVSNHVSWLDIFAINAMHPCRFVAKAEIREWPFIGWLCEQVGTIFIARGRLRDVRRIYEGLVHRLQAGEHVAFFPEGTVGAQGGVLRFHANLLEAAIEAGVPVQPYALRYLDPDGAFHPAVAYVDPITFLRSLWMIVNSPTPIRAQLLLLEPIPVRPGAHRRELADAAQAAIVSVLAQDQIDPGS